MRGLLSYYAEKLMMKQLKANMISFLSKLWI